MVLPGPAGGSVIESSSSGNPEVDRLARTVKRLRSERDKLRNEVVRLLSDKTHDWQEVDPTSSGKRQWLCEDCGHTTCTVTHTYFDPCPGDGHWVDPEHCDWEE